MKKIAAALLAASLLILPAHAGAGPVDAASAVLMEKGDRDHSANKIPTTSWSPPASPRS